MQSVSSRIWTHVIVSISYDDNHYTTGTSTSMFHKKKNKIILTLITTNTELGKPVATISHNILTSKTFEIWSIWRVLWRSLSKIRLPALPLTLICYNHVWQRRRRGKEKMEEGQLASQKCCAIYLTAEVEEIVTNDNRINKRSVIYKQKCTSLPFPYIISGGLQRN